MTINHSEGGFLYILINLMVFYEQISHPVSEEKVADGIWREFSDSSP